MKELNAQVVFGLCLIASAFVSLWAGGYWMLWGLYCFGSWAFVVFQKVIVKKLMRLQHDAAHHSTQHQFEDIILNRHDKFVEFVAGGFAVIESKLIGANVVTTIFVGKRFFMLSHEAQQFVIYHELGHLKVGNSDHPRKRIMKAFRGIMSDVETEADKFAASFIGVEIAQKSLLEMKKVAKGYLCKKEIDIRIDALAVQ